MYLFSKYIANNCEKAKKATFKHNLFVISNTLKVIMKNKKMAKVRDDVK